MVGGKHVRGVTFTELVVAVAILAISATIMVGGTRIFTSLQKQWVLYQIQREAQIAIYTLGKDIRNAKKLINITPNALEIQAMNFSKWKYDGGVMPLSINPFSDVNIGTITYRYIPDGYVAGPPGSSNDISKPGQKGYLLRREDFNGVHKDQKILTGLLSNFNTTSDRILFSTYPAAAPDFPPRAAKMRFEFGKGFWKGQPRIYEDQAWVRTGDDAQIK